MLHDIKKPRLSSRLTSILFLARYLLWCLPPLAILMIAVFDPSTHIERRQVFDRAILTKELDFDSFKDVFAAPMDAWQKTKYTTVDRSIMSDHHVWRRHEIPAAKDNQPEDYVAEFDVSMNRRSRFVLVENGTIIDDYERDIDHPTDRHVGHGLTTNFKFQSGVSPRTLFVYQNATTIAGSAVSIRKEGDYIAYNRLREIFIGLVSGVAFGLALYHAFLAIKIRERLYFYYSIFLTASLGGVAFASGLLNIAAESFGFTFTQTCNATIACIFIENATFDLFQYRFLQMEQRQHFIPKKLITLSVCFSIIGTASLFFLKPGAAVLTFAILCVPLSVSKIIWLGRKFRDPIAFTYLAMNATLLCGWILAMLLLANWVEVSALKLFLFELTTLATCAMFSSFLGKKIRALEDQRQELIARLTRRHSSSNATDSHSEATEPHTEQTYVAIMFVDVVAFSQLASPLPSRVVFQELARLMGAISELIQKHGGVIDRSLGDGLLCFFPIQSIDDFGENSLRAFRAACAIQAFIVDKFADETRGSKDKLVMPVRIGLHTSQVVIGNLGGEARVDFSMIGTGVNFASRLEAACTPFRITVSDSCYEDLKHLGQDMSAFVKIAISVKHQTGLVEAYEYDPLAAQDDAVQKVRLRYLNQLGIETKEIRVPIGDANALQLQFGDDALQVTDISVNGMKVKGARLFGQRSVLQVHLTTKDPELNQKLESKLLNKFSVEVRWGRAAPGGFEHGLRIHGGNQKQRQYIFDAICQRFGVQAATTEPIQFDQAS